MGPRSCRPVTVVLMCPRHHFPLPSSVCHSAYDNKQKRVLSRVFNCINQTRHGTHRGHGGPREHALSSKLLDLPPHLALPLPPLDRLSLVPQVLPTREPYLQLEPVLLVEVCTQPGCPTPQSQQPGPWLHRRLCTAQLPRIGRRGGATARVRTQCRCPSDCLPAASVVG